MSPGYAPSGYRMFGFPRVSGDEPLATIASVTRRVFSPRERG